ncbi:MAG TPA: HAMP domain-containing methyl-accepting chemotaxis protein [Stellaceae bacterium]|nr:HAMP domain-containing methyl-accepting chemotaxis protein [Stellaceae bacterium]
MNRFASISNLLQMITGIMAAVLVFTFAIAAGRDWERWNAALEARAVSGVSGDLFTALQNIRVERGTVNTALTAAEAASAETQADIAALRHKSEGALQSALARLDKLQLGEELTRVSDLQSKRSTLAKLRQEADTAMRLPKADRPATPTKSWVGAVNPVVEAIDGLSDRLSARIDAADPFITDMTTIKALAWSVRDAAGTDRLMVGAAIAGNNGLPQDQQRQLAELAGRMAAGWKLIGTMLQQPGMPAQVKAAYAAAEDTYFTALAEKRKAIVADLVAGQAPSLSGAEWVKLSTLGLKSVIDVANATFDVVEEYASQQAHAAMLNFFVSLGLTLFFLVVAVAVVAFVRTRIARPMAAITADMQMVARGDLKRTILFQNRDDEIGHLARALAVFRDTMTAKLRIEATQREEQERKEQRQRTIEQQVAAFDGSIRGLLDALAHAAVEMRSTSESMSATAEETDRQATAVAGAATQASANVETVASASEELSLSVGEIGRQVTHAAEIAGKAVNETRSTDVTVKGLADAAHRIGEVVQLINDIASQTNLLALNATIEAARAGDAGRGFAVVASEVKSLATQTAMATDDIAAQISSIQEATNGAVGAIKNVSRTISEVSEISASIASAIEEQSAATKEITRNTQEAARGTMSVSANIEGVSQGAGMTGKAAEQVLSAAAELSRTSERLRAEVDAFLTRIRAA